MSMRACKSLLCFIGGAIRKYHHKYIHISRTKRTIEQPLRLLSSTNRKNKRITSQEYRFFLLATLDIWEAFLQNTKHYNKLLII